MRYLLYLLLALSIPSVTGAQAANHDKEATTYLRSDSVTVSGLVDHPLTLTVKNLAGLPVTEGRAFKIIGSDGAVKGELKTFRGILLKDVLDKAAVNIAQKKERGKYYVRVIATDGYEALFTYNELFSGVAGRHIYLLFEANGKALDDEGPFMTYCTTDISSGARHVKWVGRIVVGKLD